MTRHRVRARDYLEHMRDACQKILSYTVGKNFITFVADSLLQDGVIRNLTILGEACSQLIQVLPDAQTRFPAIPFRTIYATRNRLIHGYHTLELEPIWNIVETNIPPLKATIEAILLSWPETSHPEKPSKP